MVTDRTAPLRSSKSWRFRQAPHELDALLHPAPRELDERVARAVEEPEAFAVAAMTARLGRMDAPAELDELVENAISPGVRWSRTWSRRRLRWSQQELALVLVGPAWWIHGDQQATWPLSP